MGSDKQGTQGLLEPGRNAVYPLAALTIGARLAVADA
jgi:hypothetical protein